MKKIVILALCAASFAVAEPKKCVTFADTAGEGCLVYESCWLAPADYPYACAVYHIIDEQLKTICNGVDECKGKKMKMPR